ncbi:hydrogen peroxide-inducible genes activator [Lichenicoccus sp.]|uniref:hydrogen peroxide-inducible genes activator n=1 Tax=Lichenicoccus sp. TaxID=2781899 RepID=UPI003D10F409
MTLQDLRYVVAIAEHGHFGRAAAACDVAQPTLSIQIKHLEAQLGVKLFERTTKSVSVTAVGADIVGRARHILAEIDAIMSVGQQTSGPLAADFSLGVIPTLGPYVLPWLVPALKRDYPALRLVLREDLTAPLLERLGSHRLDAALVALPVPGDRLETLALFDEPFWFAAPKGRKAASTKIMQEDELREHALLLLTEGHCLREQALAICGTAEREADGDFRATSLETILQMVATGLGSTLLPAMACGDARTRAVSIRPMAAGVGRRIGLVWRRSYPRPRDIHLLAQTLCDHLPSGVHRV